MLGAEKQQGVKSGRALGFSPLFKLLYENSHYYQHPTHAALDYESIFCVIWQRVCFMKNAGNPTGCGAGTLRTT